MIFLDRFIIDKVDRGAAWTQRQGANLLMMKLYCVVFAFAMLIASAIAAWPYRSTGHTIFFIGFNALLGFFEVRWRIEEYDRYRDYPDVARSAALLNAKALMRRDMQPFVFVRIFISVLGVSTAFMSSLWINIAWVGVCTLLYLDCAFFLGPGQHSRAKQKSTASNMLGQGGAP